MAWLHSPSMSLWGSLVVTSTQVKVGEKSHSMCANSANAIGSFSLNCLLLRETEWLHMPELRKCESRYEDCDEPV